MKKLIVLAALGVAGFMSAKGNVSEVTKSKGKQNVVVNVTKESVKTKAAFIYRWIGIESPCGAVYFLNADDYSSWSEFMDDVTYFNGQKCGYDLGPIV